jgi:hypothetical protein
VPKSDSYAPVRLNDLLFLAGAVTADGHPSDGSNTGEQAGLLRQMRISEIHGPQPVTSDRRGCTAWLAECERCSIHLSTILPDEDLVFHPLGVERIEPTSNPTQPEILDAVKP